MLLYFTFLFLFSLNLVQAEDFGYGKTEELPINYSLIPTVNNSEYFNGYSVSSLWSYYSNLGDSIWCKLTGCTMEGNINMNGNSLLNIDTAYFDNIEIFDNTITTSDSNPLYIDGIKTRFTSDDGVSIGVNNNFDLSVDFYDAYIKQLTADKDIYIQYNDGGVNKTAMFIDGDTGRIAIAGTTTEPAYEVNLNGDVFMDGDLRGMDSIIAKATSDLIYTLSTGSTDYSHIFKTYDGSSYVPRITIPTTSGGDFANIQMNDSNLLIEGGLNISDNITLKNGETISNEDEYTTRFEGVSSGGNTIGLEVDFDNPYRPILRGTTSLWGTKSIGIDGLLTMNDNSYQVFGGGTDVSTGFATYDGNDYYRTELRGGHSTYTGNWVLNRMYYRPNCNYPVVNETNFWIMSPDQSNCDKYIRFFYNNETQAHVKVGEGNLTLDVADGYVTKTTTDLEVNGSGSFKNITLDNGGKVWDNATCTFISSPDGSNVLDICNS